MGEDVDIYDVAIVTVGDELLSGSIVDTNSSTIASRLMEVGLEVGRMVTVGDEPERIREILQEMARRARVVVVTGGLGPTRDDRTAQAAAEAFGKGLVLNVAALERIRTIFRKHGLEMTPNNERQAYIPEGAQMIPNPVGTAPGFCLREGHCLLIFLPGVPRELEAMFGEVIERLIIPHFPKRPSVRASTLKIFGMTESKIDSVVKGALDGLQGVTLASLPRYPENRLRIVVKAPGPEEAHRLLEEAQRRIVDRLGHCVYGVDEDEMETVVWRLLADSRRTLAVAESCTGGLIAHRITNVPGSSEVLIEGIVAYNPRVKVEMLGVPRHLLEMEGVVSARTAEQMAKGVRIRAGAHLGIASTGVAGPSGGTKETPVGTVFLGLSDSRGVWSQRFLFRGDRQQIKYTAATAALDWLRLYLLGRDPLDYDIPWKWRGR